MDNQSFYDKIEFAFQDFKKRNCDCQFFPNVEYLGANLSENSATPIFKVYYTTAKSIKNFPPLLMPLKKHDMIYALNRVDDNIN